MCTCEIRSHIEGMKSRYAQTVIVGWAVSLNKRELLVQVTRGKQSVQGLQVEWTERPDILSAFFARCVQGQQAETKGQQAAFGFRISFPSSPEETYRLTFLVKGDKRQRQVYVIRGERAELTGLEGVKNRLKKGVKRLSGRGEDRQNGRNGANGDLRSGQAGQERAGESDPLISVIVPVYRPEPVHFMEMIRSVMEQTYGKWQLCLADGSEDDGSLYSGRGLERLVREASRGDERVVYRKLERNFGISGNTNQALAMARGQWIAMVDHDDLLEPDALAEAVRLLKDKPKAGFIYTDSDLTDMDGIKFYNTLLKPDWSPETLYSANYITHFSMIRKDIIEAADGFDPQMDGAQDWDIFFKAAERAEEICHIPKVLYHWRVAKTSTARSVETKPYALDAQLRAINAHFRRMGYEAQAFFQDRDRYLIRVKWSRNVRWQMLRFEESSGVGHAEKMPEKIGTQTMLQMVYIIDFGTVEPVVEEVCQELAQWAVCDGIGLVFPKLLDKDGRIVSAGMMAEEGNSTEDHVAVLYQGSEDHMADQMGNTDWYRNVKAQYPSLFAVSAENWEKFGSMGSESSLTEYARRLSEAGLRHLMNPFARAVLNKN